MSAAVLAVEKESQRQFGSGQSDIFISHTVKVTGVMKFPTTAEETMPGNCFWKFTLLSDND